MIHHATGLLAMARGDSDDAFAAFEVASTRRRCSWRSTSSAASGAAGSYRCRPGAASSTQRGPRLPRWPASSTTWQAHASPRPPSIWPKAIPKGPSTSSAQSSNAGSEPRRRHGRQSTRRCWLPWPTSGSAIAAAPRRRSSARSTSRSLRASSCRSCCSPSGSSSRGTPGTRRRTRRCLPRSSRCSPEDRCCPRARWRRCVRRSARPSSGSSGTCRATSRRRRSRPSCSSRTTRCGRTCATSTRSSTRTTAARRSLVHGARAARTRARRSLSAHWCEGSAARRRPAAFRLTDRRR